MTETDLRFIATAEKGQVSAVLNRPENSRALVILAHGAGANMRHRHMQSLSTMLADQGIASFRYNFPTMQAGGKRTDSQAVCIETVSNAVDLAHRVANDLPLFIGGHSFGGRMSSHAVVRGEPHSICRGLIYFSFPLHPSKRPATSRADHLYCSKLPMLFLSGTRDSLAEPPLLEEITSRIPNATLHWLDTADHSFNILKRSRKSAEDVYQEAARVAASYIDGIINLA